MNTFCPPENFDFLWPFLPFRLLQSNPNTHGFSSCSPWTLYITYGLHIIFTSWIVGGSFWESVKISWCLLITRISIKLIKPTIQHRVLLPGFNHNWPGNITLHWNWQYMIVKVDLADLPGLSSSGESENIWWTRADPRPSSTSSSPNLCDGMHRLNYIPCPGLGVCDDHKVFGTISALHWNVPSAFLTGILSNLF